MKRLRRSGIGTSVIGALAVVWIMGTTPAVAAPDVGCGALEAFKPDGEPAGPCPLKHTDVQVEVSGFVARVNVTQLFANPYSHKIEAIYTFPLSQDAAVDDMTMIIGERVIRGLIKEREEARQIYERAKQAGHTASLLDQERPNIFTQSVANIEPGQQVEIRIGYVENLDWQDGVYSFDFPTVVGPRYMPGGATGHQGTGWAPDTDQVPDASRISPPVTPPGTRSGHDISIAVNLRAGLPIRNISSPQHEVDVEYGDHERTAALVRLKERATIPNRDFVLKFQTASNDIADALFTHTDERGGFFTLVLQPPQRVRPEWIVPKEMIFVIDKSGSMSGFPIETAKQTMRLCIENLKPTDTFNLMTFAGGVGFCFPRAVPNTQDNQRQALQYLHNLQGSGGTEMMKAISACLGGEKDAERVRIVCFMTDGFVGNDMTIIDAVQRNADTSRVFSFGIGSSVNRFLLDGMARAGRGAVEYVLAPDQASEASTRFYERVSTPVLTDVQLDWSGLTVEDVYPRRLPDLFSAQPVVVHGRYAHGGHGQVTLRGQRGSEAFARTIDVLLPEEHAANEVLASLWARARVDDLMNSDLAGVQRGQPDPGLKERIVALALRYRLLTQFTSFVAVEETTVTRDGELVTVTVPVEMPQGVSYEGVFGIKGEGKTLSAQCVQNLRSLGYVRGRSGGTPRPKPRAPSRLDVSDNARLFSTNGAREESVVGLPEGDTVIVEPERLHGGELPPKKAPQWQKKLDPALLDLAGKLDAKGNYAKDRILVRDGRVEIAVTLTDATAERIARLEALGFQVLQRSIVDKAMIIGAIDLSKLEALAQLEFVQRVEPTAWSSLK